jgi:hypothetical protein
VVLAHTFWSLWGNNYLNVFDCNPLVHSPLIADFLQGVWSNVMVNGNEDVQHYSLVDGIHPH